MAYLDMDDILAAVSNSAPLAQEAPNNFLMVSGNRLEGLGALGRDHVTPQLNQQSQSISQTRTALRQAQALVTAIRGYQSRLQEVGEVAPTFDAMIRELDEFSDELADMERIHAAWKSGSHQPWRWGQYGGLDSNNVPARIDATVARLKSEAQAEFNARYNDAVAVKRQKEQEDYARSQYEAEQERKRQLEEQRLQRDRELEERRIQLEEQRAAREAQMEEQRLAAQLQSEQARMNMDLAMQQQQLQLQAAQEQARMQMEAQRAAMEQQLAMQAAMPAAPASSTAYYGVLPVGQGYAPGYGYDAWAQPGYSYEPNYYAAPPAYSSAPAAPMVDYGGGGGGAAWSPGGNELFGLRGLGLTLTPTQLAAAQQAGAAVGSGPPVPGMVMSPSGRWVNPTTTVTVTRPNAGPGVVEGAVNALTSTVNALAPTALQFAELFSGRRSAAPSPVPVQQSSSLGDWLLPAAAVAGGAYLLFGRKKAGGRRRGR